MDDKPVNSITSFHLSIALALALAASATGALELEYFSPAEKAKLVADFESAKQAHIEDVVKKPWNCDMYGVRSRMQVQRQVKLYRFRQLPNSPTIQNSGSQVVSSYKLENNNLVGRDSRLEDQLRLTAEGKLISRLSLRAAASPTVLAYSICSPL